MPLSLHVIREMERKRGEEGERTKTSRSTTLRNQQRDGKDKRTDRLQRDEGRRMIKCREEDQIRWRGGSREGEVLGRGGNGQRKEGKKERDGGIYGVCGGVVVNTTCKKKKKDAHPFMLGDNLTIRRRTALFCSESEIRERENHRAREEQEEGRESETSGRLDRWYNLEKERGRESYEFKN